MLMCDGVRGGRREFSDVHRTAHSLERVICGPNAGENAERYNIGHEG
ncbi:Hypothetical protein Cul210932_0932 [Corynebacterium ulcerans]|uniref:Uncharacterized protein n=1 Tax=Corynebacterium ulcerans FRC58 TaxID=1408268 RepID=A0ABM5U131_CORUL|nr:Hypothetical protein Cul210932_0932 [Corynebacterium ulcerans]AIU91534.1 Hypothetical protein Cul05146_0957 [Corynebacterium ulcerans]AKA96450.1 Hypothetical protein CUL131002_0910 [Corynebacterium ulcerans]AKN76827.1 Hypothetical protein CulFRC58_0973 [Corynebacterium ulcerans FRC58]ALD94666.1 Hypothetical protein Cul131001_0951 [Corynebacterium ulcerans]